MRKYQPPGERARDLSAPSGCSVCLHFQLETTDLFLPTKLRMRHLSVLFTLCCRIY